jgi:transposase-like protein
MKRGMISRVIAAIRNEPERPRSHYCPACFSKNLKVLGSNAARLDGHIHMVFTCLDCKRDLEMSIFRSTGPTELRVCMRPQARAVNHTLAEIWDWGNEEDKI